MTDDIFRQYNTAASAAKGFSGPIIAWHSGRGMPQSITYKLKDKAVVCKITFLTRGKSWEDNREKDCPTNFRIEGSHDGSSFVLIKRVEGKKNRNKMVFAVINGQ